MTFLTIVLIATIILAVIGLGWQTFTIAVLDGFNRTLDAGIPIIKNLTQEAQAYGDPNVIQGLHSDEDIQSRIAETQNYTRELLLQAPDEEMKSIWGNSAMLMIYSNQDWSGAVMDSSGDSETIDRASSEITDGIEGVDMFECVQGGVYSVSFQKGTDQGYLDLVLIKAGKILDEGSTTADYGVIRLSGVCS